MHANLLWYTIILFVLAFAAGTLTLVRSWSDDFLHLFVSFGAGIFLGAVFFELLPEAMQGDDKRMIGVAVLAGYLFILFIERFLFAHGGEGYDHAHRVISIAAFIGLSVHSLIDGLGLSVSVIDANIGQAVFLSILAHHVPAAFSVGSLLFLGRVRKPVVVALLLLFSAMPSLGALFFAPLVKGSSEQTFSIIVGVMTGTFLYVVTADLLPEVFHSRKNRWPNLALLVVGLLVMAAIGFGFHHVHERAQIQTNQTVVGIIGKNNGVTTE